MTPRGRRVRCERTRRGRRDITLLHIFDREERPGRVYLGLGEHTLRAVCKLRTGEHAWLGHCPDAWVVMVWTLVLGRQAYVIHAVLG